MWLVMFLVAAGQVALASQVKITPVEITQFDLGKMQGALVNQLAWSPDGQQIYLQTITEDRKALPKDIYHYVMAAEKGAAFKKVSAPPDWAVAYWTWKSGQSAPDDAAFKIDIATDKRIDAATALPMGGDMARGGASTGNGASAESVMAAAATSTNATVYSMRLKGEVIGEWADHRIMPGLTFGWGPPGTHLIAYAEKQTGRLVIMDSTGAKQKIEETKGVVLPAWTSDGTRLAYLESIGRNKYALIIASVTR